MIITTVIEEEKQLKRLQKLKKYFLPDFWNVTALQFRFQKSIKSLLLQLFPFLLLLSLS